MKNIQTGETEFTSTSVLSHCLQGIAVVLVVVLKVFLKVIQRVRKVGDDSCEESIVYKLQQHPETNGNRTDIIPNNTADRSENFFWKSVRVNSKIHEKIEGVKFVSFFIKVTRNWRRVNRADINTTRFKLDCNACCKGTYVRLSCALQSAKRCGLTGCSG